MPDKTTIPIFFSWMFRFPDMIEVGKRVKEFSQMAFVLSFPTFLRTLCSQSAPFLAILMHLTVQNTRNDQKIQERPFPPPDLKNVKFSNKQNVKSKYIHTFMYIKKGQKLDK